MILSLPFTSYHFSACFRFFDISVGAYVVSLVFDVVLLFLQPLRLHMLVFMAPRVFLILLRCGPLPWKF